MMMMIATLGTFLCIVGIAFGTLRGEKLTEIMQSLLNKHDPRVRPDYGEKPTAIETSAYFLRLVNFNEKDGMISLECYYREMWNDPRLKYQILFFGLEKITFGSEIHKKIWEPDTFISNGEGKNNGRDMFYKISPNGDVMRSLKMIFQANCPENFRNYPMDTQICELEMESYGHTADDITYDFKKGIKDPIGSGPLQFNNLRVFAIQKRTQIISLTSGNYSRLILRFHIVRNPGQYLKYLYTPAILTFMVTCAVFWLPVSSILLRGILAFLSLNVYMGLMCKGGHGVEVGYMTRLDQYMITCSVLALIAFLESISVYFCLYTKRPHAAGHLKNSDEDDDAEIIIDSSQMKQQKDPQEKGEFKKIGDYLNKGAKYVLNIRHHRRGLEKLDLVFRVVYPIFFVIFNIAYWVISYGSIKEHLGMQEENLFIPSS